MSNMAYCRFENTLDDLRDCERALDDISGELSDLSDEEAIAAHRLLKVCQRLMKNYGHVVESVS